MARNVDVLLIQLDCTSFDRRQYHWKESINILESLHESKDQGTAPSEAIFFGRCS